MTNYSNVIAELMAMECDNPLDAGIPNRHAYNQLRNLSIESAFGETTFHDREMARACLSGLWLYHNYLDESHTISQSIDTSTGSFWHGIMHRREGDFSNAKYWFRRVGVHSVFDELPTEAMRIAREAKDSEEAQHLLTQPSWDPSAFVDLCESAQTDRLQLDSLCRAIQRREWEKLFDYCYRQAIDS